MSFIDFLEKRYYAYRKYIPARILYHPEYFKVMDMLDSGPEGIRAAADAQLRHILTVACNHVPYYRQTMKLSAAELANESPRELLQCFPFLTKAEIMSRQRDFLDERLNPRFLNYVTSGGSSGQGIGMWRNKRLADIEKAFLTHEWGKTGFTFDKSMYLRIGADARRFAHEEPTRVIGNRLMLSPYHVEPKHRDHIVRALNAIRPDYVHAYPSSASALAEVIRDSDLDFRVKAVFLVSEPVTHQQLAAISGLFHAPISMSYGQSERTNLAFARYDAGRYSPYRFEPLYSITENLFEGDSAEIVGTSLWNDVMPLIRYRTNDFGKVDANGMCDVIDGREQEFLIDRTGNRIPGLSIVIDEVTWDFVRLYQIRQQRPGAIRLAVVGKHGPLSDEQKQFVLGAQLKRWGSFFDIDLEEVPDIPLAPNGKRKLVETRDRVAA
jgi:phenylacetate-CoA ligase